MDVSRKIIKAFLVSALASLAIAAPGLAQSSDPGNPLRQNTMIASPVVESWSSVQVAAGVTPEPRTKPTSNRQLIEQTPPEIRRILFPGEPIDRKPNTTESGSDLPSTSHSTTRNQLPGSAQPVRHDDQAMQGNAKPLGETTTSQDSPNSIHPARSESVERVPTTLPENPTGEAVTPRVDPNVQPAGYHANVANVPTHADPGTDLISRIRERTGIDGAERTEPGRQVTDLLQRLATYTSLVLVLGIGFIVILKKWAQRPGRQELDVDSDKIQIKSTLKLSAKASVHLLQAGSHRFVVATDATGIQNVMLLGHDFQDTLEQFGPFFEHSDSAPHEAVANVGKPIGSDRDTPGQRSGSERPTANHQRAEVREFHSGGRARQPDGATPRDFGRKVNGGRGAARESMREAAKQQTTDPKIHDLLDRLKDGEIKDLIQQSLKELS